MKYQYKNGSSIKFKLNKKRAVILLIVAFILIVSVLVIDYYPWSITTVSYKDVTLAFAVNLRDAKNSPVYPDEEAVSSLINNSNVQKITFVLQNTSDSYLSKLEAVEITLKLSYALKIFDPSFFSNVQVVDSFDNLNSTSENPSIVLAPPSLADGNYVRVVNNSVFISGKDKNNFDLSTAKFIISALGINV